MTAREDSSLNQSEKNLMTELGVQIRERRLMCNFSQEELADRIGANRSYISDIERGLSSPTIIFLAKVASALGTKLWKLIKSIEEAAG